MPPATVATSFFDRRSSDPKGMPPGAIGDVNSAEPGTGARYNAGKPPYELIPLRFIADSYRERAVVDFDALAALAALHALGRWQETGREAFLYAALKEMGAGTWQDCARVLDYGRKKYAEWNWAKGMPWSVPLGCAVRHLLAMLDGEQNDPESGEHHRGHVAANIVMLLQYQRTYPQGDDRPRMLDKPT